MERLYDYLPKELVQFLLVTLFSLFIGLSQRHHILKDTKESVALFGTDRTFTFIGVLGYLLYILDPHDMRLYMGGGLLLGVLFALNYYVKQLKLQSFGMTTIVIALITYCIPPLVCTQPSWFYIMVVVVVLLLTELKSTFIEFASRMKNDEMITLAKFLAISGIILPILPSEPILDGLSITPYSIWFATVVVSGISYLSYLLKRYVFQDAGILVSGVLGGLYSSTATITVLAKKCRYTEKELLPEYVSAMLLAISMMFLRFCILIFIFSKEIFFIIYPFLLIMMIVAALVSFFIHHKYSLRRGKFVAKEEKGNPLEFKVALIFSALFVLFSFITHYTVYYGGVEGLNLLSVISGFSDITPFVLNLLEGSGEIVASSVAVCTLQAIVSNIAVNMGYAIFFSGRQKQVSHLIVKGFGVVILFNLLLLIVFYLW